MNRQQGGNDWAALSDLVCGILKFVNAGRENFEVEASRRGLTLDQLTAAAIVEAIAERVEPGAAPRRGLKPRQ